MCIIQPSHFLQVAHPSQLGLEVGDTVNVKYLGRDFLGRHQISRKELFEPEITEDSVRITISQALNDTYTCIIKCIHVLVLL